MRWSALIPVLLATLPGFAGEQPTPTAPAVRATPRPTPGPRSLADAARQIRLQSPARDAEGRIVISDTNLPELADRGSVTAISGDRSADRRYVEVEGQGEGGGSASSGMDPEEKRELWRRKFQAQAKAVAVIEARISELDREIPGLWNQFYAWDDPAYRDGVIKVRLDRALAEWEELTAKLPGEREKLEQIREEARQDGAQPGWFRDLE